MFNVGHTAHVEETIQLGPYHQQHFSVNVHHSRSDCVPAVLELWRYINDAIYNPPKEEVTCREIRI